jgi:hypothetical protein
MTNKEQEASVIAKLNSEQEESFWSQYCIYLESLKHGDEVIDNEPSPERKQRLINDKKGIEALIPKLREGYRKKYGRPVDDSTCSKYQ